jgi:hypothetical protein
MLDGPFRGSEAVARGRVTPARLRGKGFRRLFPDVYVPASVEVDLRVRSRAAYLWSDGRGVLSGWSAAEALGASCAPADVPAELTMTHEHVRAPRGARVGQAELRDDEVRRRGAIRLTGPLRTAFDLCRREPLVDAVVALDSLAGRFGFEPADLLTFAERYPRARGVRSLPEVVTLANPQADSAMETRLRLILVRGGLPPPTAQYPVVDERGRVVTEVDLAYPEILVAVEYDGADHFAAPQVLRDGHRLTRLAALGWRVYRYYAADVYRRPERIVNDVRLALTTRVIPPRHPSPPNSP